jgi:hypothetical protein
MNCCSLLGHVFPVHPCRGTDRAFLAQDVLLPLLSSRGAKAAGYEVGHERGSLHAKLSVSAMPSLACLSTCQLGTLAPRQPLMLCHCSSCQDLDAKLTLARVLSPAARLHLLTLTFTDRVGGWVGVMYRHHTSHHPSGTTLGRSPVQSLILCGMPCMRHWLVHDAQIKDASWRSGGVEGLPTDLPPYLKSWQEYLQDKGWSKSVLGLQVGATSPPLPSCGQPCHTGHVWSDVCCHLASGGAPQVVAASSRAGATRQLPPQ